MFDIKYSVLFASMIWSSVGTGFFIYGKKQGETVPLIGGIVLFGVSCVFMGSALYMSLVSVAVIAAIFWLKGRF